MADSKTAASTGDFLRKALPIAGVGATALAASTGVLNFDLPKWAEDIARQSGPWFLIWLSVFAGIRYFVPRDAVPSFIKSQFDIALGLQRQADTIQSVGELVKTMAANDSTKFEAILVGQEMAHQELQGVHTRLDSIEAAIRGLKANG